MNIRHIFMTIAAIMLASAALADSSSVTSKKYVDDFMTGYQNKIPGSGTNKLMIYDSNESDGINQKAIVSELGTSTSATDVPNVGAVKAGIDGKQDTINGTAGYVMTGTGNTGVVDEKPIYGATTNYSDALVTAEAVNTGVINAVNNSLIRVNENGVADSNGTLWQISDYLLAINAKVPYGYTELEYVNMSTGSYLLTDLVPTYGSKIEMDFETTSIPAGTATFFGGRNTTSSGAGFQLAKINSGLIVDAFGTASSDRYASNIAAQSNTRYKYTYNNQVATLESGGTTVFTNTFTGTTNNAAALAINALNNNGTVINNTAGIYLYSFKMWNAQGGLIADYIPATYNNTVGFYDTVSGTFKTATSSTFTAGPTCVSPNLFDGEIELGSIDPMDGSLVVNNGRTRSANFIPVQPNTIYTFTREDTNGIRWIVGYDKNHNGITDGLGTQASAVKNISAGIATATFTTTATTYYLKWYNTSNAGLNEKVQLELGSTATAYRPYGNTCY